MDEGDDLRDETDKGPTEGGDGPEVFKGGLGAGYAVDESGETTTSDDILFTDRPDGKKKVEEDEEEDEGEHEERWEFGVAPTHRDRLEAGLQDSLDLSNWNKPGLTDYFWYLLVYGGTMALAAYVIIRYQTVWAYTIWGAYLAMLVIASFFLVRSISYRRGTYSKRFEISTLDMQQAIEAAIEEMGLRVLSREGASTVFLRHLIETYAIDDRPYTVRLEGRDHLPTKTVSVGRFRDQWVRKEVRELCLALDEQVDQIRGRKVKRALFE